MCAKASMLLKASPVFTFANQAGLDMLETALVTLQGIMLDKVLDEAGRMVFSFEFSKIMQQFKVFTCAEIVGTFFLLQINYMGTQICDNSDFQNNSLDSLKWFKQL